MGVLAAGADGVEQFAYLVLGEPGQCSQPLSETQVQLTFAALSGEEWTSHDLRKTARTA